MAIKIAVEYTNAVPADANYPGGSFKNRTGESSTDGTPLEKAWANDLYGFGEAILAEGGVVHSGAPDTALASDRLDALKNILADLNNPVGTIRAFAVATDPATLLGVGTWTRIGAGRMVVDAGANGGTTFTAGAVGGEVNHILTVAEMPAHNHKFYEGPPNAPGDSTSALDSVDGSTSGLTIVSQNTGGGGAHNNMPPYYVGYIWRRTA